MAPMNRPTDAVHMFMNEVTSRVVAGSGIPTDRFHLGKMIFQSLKDAPNNIMQIDGITGLSETNKTVLEKSVRCAISMQNYGLKCGDVIVLMAPNYLDLAAPFYAALYLGAAIAAIDRTLTVQELQSMLNITKPKIIFCQNEKSSDIQQALNDLDLNSLVIAFNKTDCYCSFSDFLERYGNANAADVEKYKPSDFNAEDNIALLISTSGTTGCFKFAAAAHKHLVISLPYMMARFTNFPTPFKMALVASPLQWLSALIHFLYSPIFGYIMLQTSANFTPEHVFYLINTYKPTYLILSPTAMTTLIRQPNRDQCDFTCLEHLILGGSAVSKDLVEEVQNVTLETEIFIAHGMSELCGLSFMITNEPPGSCGKPIGSLQYRIINVETQEDINEPNIPGELWVKGPGIFKEYYNDPEATAEAFTEDRWFKTGDLFYRDENWNFFFVDRTKLLLKYKNNQISPTELENVIRQHPSIFDVAVTAVPDTECGDLPVACVVLRTGSHVTADEIKQLVKESLSDAKQLRGGVVFLSELPQTASSKIHRKKLKEMVLTMERL